MTGHEWKVLASFGFLLGAIAMFDAQTAKYVAGVAVAVIVVKNADKLPLVGDTKPAKAAAPRPTTTMHV